MREVIMRLIPEEFDEDYHAEILQDLVRCKDCIYGEDAKGVAEGVVECKRLKMVTKDDWYCAEGRRDEAIVQD